MDLFSQALTNAEIERQNKEELKKAKQAYIKELIKIGIDKATAKTMANVEFEYGLKKAM